MPKIKEVYLVKFDGEKAEKILDSANAIARSLPKLIAGVECDICGVECLLFYSDPEIEYKCAACFYQEQGIIPVQGKYLEYIKSKGQTHGFNAEGRRVKLP